jgi:hypothetical protein
MPDAAPAATDVAALRQTCSDAMNKDPSFAQSIIKVANEETALKHLQAADRIARNEQHVIAAYAAMWIAAVVFLVFLWKRQSGLKAQIARLSADLDAATKDDKPASSSPGGGAKKP